MAKYKRRLQSTSTMQVTVANYECHFAFEDGPHWNTTVRGMSLIVIKKLGDELGGQVVDRAISGFRQRRESRVRQRLERDSLWDLLE